MSYPLKNSAWGWSWKVCDSIEGSLEKVAILRVMFFLFFFFFLGGGGILMMVHSQNIWK